MSVVYLQKVLRESDAEGEERMLLMVMADLATETGSFWASEDLLAARTRMPVERVSIVRNRLIASGEIRPGPAKNIYEFARL